MKYLVIFLCIIWYSEAIPNSCCPNNGTLKGFRCVNNASLWVQNACKHEAYTLRSDEYVIKNDDTLMEVPDMMTVEKNGYCVGYMEGDQMAMVCFPEQDEERGMSRTGVLVCSCISIISLILTLIVYIILPNLRDLQGKCMMFTILSLTISFISLAVLQDYYIIQSKSCIALGFILYFWFIATFFWLNVVSFNVWRSVVRPKLFASRKYMFAVYNLYGWGMPLILLSILLICQHSEGDHIKPKFGDSKCWFHELEAQKAYFYGPICTILIVNIILFISTAWQLSKQSKNSTERKYRSHKYKMYLYLKLFVVMGICWIFEPLSAFIENPKELWFITDYVNALQGLTILLILVVFRKRVRRDLAKKANMCCRGLPKEWVTFADEYCEELEEDVDDISSGNETPVIHSLPTQTL